MAARRVKFGIGIRRGSIDHVLDQAVIADRSGFDSAWMADHFVGFPVNVPYFDPYTVLGALSAKTHNVRIVVGATDVFRRHPSILAQMLLTLDHLTKGRTGIALCIGEAMNLSPFGFDKEKPLIRLKEMMQTMRLLMVSSPSIPANFVGNFFRFDGAFFQMRPVQQPHPPLYLAANGPKTRKLVGELADGWVPMMMTPETFKKDLQEIAESAAEVGRNPSVIDTVYHVDFALASSKDEARRLLAPGVKKIILAFPHMAKRLGFQVPEDFAWEHLTLNTETEEKMKTFFNRIPDDVIDMTSICGTAGDCVRQMQAFIEAGVGHFVLRSANPIREVCEAFSRTISPYFRN